MIWPIASLRQALLRSMDDGALLERVERLIPEVALTKDGLEELSTGAGRVRSWVEPRCESRAESSATSVNLDAMHNVENRSV